MSLETGTISDMRREKRPGWQLPLWMMVLLKNCPAFSTNLTGGELMTKIRVHEYAKQIDKSSKEVIEQLAKLNIQVTNHMSTLEGDAVQN